MINIHPTAIINGDVHIEDGVEIGPFSVIMGPCHIGAYTLIDSHCVIGEGIGDEMLKIGRQCHIRSQSIVYSGCILGDHTHTGHGAVIREHTLTGIHCMIGTRCDLQGRLSLGNYVRLHSDVHLCQGSMVGNFVFIYPRVTFTNDKYPPSTEVSGPRVGDYTQIGAGALLMPGITIGDNCLVAANSVVTRDFPSMVLIKGSPAIKEREIADLRDQDSALYPWPNRFDRNMPWEGNSFAQWAEGNRLDL